MIQPARQPTRLAPGEIDPVQPLDPTHPLTRGLEGFWLPLPRLSGGERLYDLSGHRQHADLISTSYGVDQRYPHPILPMPDGGGSSDQGGVISPATHPLGAEDRTAMLRFTLTKSINGDRHFFGVGEDTTGGRWEFKFDDNSGLRIEIGGLGRTSSLVVSEGDTVVVGCTLNGSTIGDHILYLDGSTEQTFGSSDIQTGGSEIALGRAITEVGTNLGFRSTPFILGAAALYERGFTVTEMDRWAAQARRGFPDLLRRRDESALYVSGTSAISLTTNELRHAHTLGPSSVSAQYALTTNELQQTHALAAPGLSVGYSLTTAEMQQAHTLESPSLAIAGLLTPDDVQHGHTLESTLTSVQFALATDALQQPHTLEASGADVAYALTPQGLQHLHSLAPSTLEAIFGLTPEDLSQAHTIESPSGSALVILSVDGMTHPHDLGQVTLGTVGFATKIDVSASPLYQTDSDVDTLYQITLNAEPILD